MPSKPRKLSPKEIAGLDATRDIGAEILQSIEDVKAGGVSVRTLQGWEQGREQPSGAARALLAIAKTNPKAILAVSAQ